MVPQVVYSARLDLRLATGNAGSNPAIRAFCVSLPQSDRFISVRVSNRLLNAVGIF